MNFWNGITPIRHSLKYPRHRDSGFTLVETLTVVAILVILLALSFVGVAKYRDYLKITELDNAARDIYMAAQNRAILLNNSQRLAVDLAVGGTGGATPVSVTLSDGSTPATTGTCYICQDAGNLDELLPVGTVDPALRDGKFYIVYEPETASVTDVFYTERDAIPGIEELLPIKKDRNARMTPMVGYYGSDRGANIGTNPLPTPGVEVLIDNGEELTLTVRYTLPVGLPSGVAITREPEVALAYGGSTITLLDGTSSPYPSRLKTGSGWDEHSGVATYTWVLDSLKSDMQFKGLKTSLTDLGDDFNVIAGLTLKAVASDGNPAPGYIDSAYYATGKDNSLFAKGSTYTTNAAEVASGTALIANLRHLQNLSLNEAAGFSSLAYSGSTSGVVEARQLCDIYCESYLGSEYKFVPIVNSRLVSYDGDSDHIYNLSTINTANAGLFGSVSNFDISNCRVCWSTPEKLVNAGGTDYVYAVSGTTNAGGLIGSASGTVNITNSFAATTVSGATAAGGLIGSASGTVNITRSYADCYLKGASAGGLIGSGSGSAALHECYAAGFIIAGGANTAGLVNSSVDSTSADVYSIVRVLGTDGSLTAPATTLDNGGSVRYLSAATDVNAAAKPFGDEFKYGGDRPETHVYDLRYKISNPKDNNLKLEGKVYPYPWISGLPHYDDWADLGAPPDELPVKLAYYEVYMGKTTVSTTCGLSFDHGMGSLKPDNASLASLNLTKDGYALVIKTDALAPVAPATDNVLTNATVTYGGNTWTLTGSGTTWTWTLTGSGVAAPAQPAFTKDDEGYTVIPLPDAIVNAEHPEGASYAAANFYQKLELKADTAAGRNFGPDAFGSPIENIGYYFNPHFAKTVAASGAPTAVRPTTVPTAGAGGTKGGNGDVSVRTPRHLYDLSNYQGYAKNRHQFKQELDLNYSVYTAFVDYGIFPSVGGNNDSCWQYPITAFNGRYDGGCNTISNVFFAEPAAEKTTETGTETVGLFSRIWRAVKNFFSNLFGLSTTAEEPPAASPESAGLFGESTGTLVNVVYRLYYLYERGEVISSKNVGALLGFNNGGTVDNCAVYGVRMKVTGAESVGGLVGCNKGTIKGSSAEVVSLTVDAVDAGGLVGYSSGTVEDSYAVGQVFGECSNFAAGLVGRLDGGSISNSYAGVDISTVETPGAAPDEKNTHKFGLCGVEKEKFDENRTIANVSADTNCWLMGIYRYRGQTYAMEQSIYADGEKYALSATDFKAKTWDLAATDQSVYEPTPLPTPTADNPDGADSRGYTYTDYAGTTFPYATGVTRDSSPIHYGLWPVESMEISLFYYEEYDAGDGKSVYGLYRAGQEGKFETLDLLRDDLPVKSDGYALGGAIGTGFLQKDQFTVQYGDAKKQVVLEWTGDKDKKTKTWKWTWADNKSFGAVPSADVVCSPAGEVTVHGYTLIFLPDLMFTWHMEKNGGSDLAIAVYDEGNGFYHRITAWPTESDGSTTGLKDTYEMTYYFNPHFAKSVVESVKGEGYPKGSSDVPTKTSDGNAPIIIRTARQLNCMGKNYRVQQEGGNKIEITYIYTGGKQYHFVQERDIDYGTYTGYQTVDGEGNVTDWYIQAHEEKTVTITAEVDKLGENGEPVQRQKVDENGKPVTDKDGKPVMETVRETVTIEKKVLVPHFQTPIGGYSTGKNNTFTGTYNGNCHIIRNVMFDCGTGNSTSYYGLFGKSTGTLENIVYELNPDYQANLWSLSTDNTGGVGALVGVNNGTVRNCAVSGVNWTAEIQGLNNTPIGGLVGYNTGVVKNCAAEVMMHIVADAGKEKARVGGLVGSHFGTEVSDSYAVGRMTGNALSVGGLIGLVEYKESVSGEGRTSTNIIKNCYAAVDLTEMDITYGGYENQKGGLVGVRHSEKTSSVDSFIVNSYWLKGLFFYRGKVYETKSSNMCKYNTGMTLVADWRTGISWDELASKIPMPETQEGRRSWLGGFFPDPVPNTTGQKWYQYYHSKDTVDGDDDAVEGTPERFPYITGVKDADGSAAHYGLWPVELTQLIPQLRLAYYEVYAFDEKGIATEFGAYGLPEVENEHALRDDSMVLLDGYALALAKKDRGSTNGTVEATVIYGSMDDSKKTYTLKCTLSGGAYAYTLDGGTVVPNYETKDYLLFNLPDNIVNGPTVDYIENSGGGKPETFYQKLVTQMNPGENWDVYAEGAFSRYLNTADIEDTVAARTRYFNPHFAKTEITPEKAADGTDSRYTDNRGLYLDPNKQQEIIIRSDTEKNEDGSYKIIESWTENRSEAFVNGVAVRSARQFNALSRYWYNGEPDSNPSIMDARKLTFKQELNIDYAGYQWSAIGFASSGDSNLKWDAGGYYKQVPIGEDKGTTDANKLFNGTYDGGDHELKGVFPESKDKYKYVGLFGNAKDGTLQNINYVLPTANDLTITTGNSETKLGMLAGTANTLDNCTITAKGPTIVTLTNSYYSIPVGGMAGVVTTATNCKLDGRNLTLVLNKVTSGGGLFAEASGNVSGCEVSLKKLEVNNGHNNNTWIGGLVGQAGSSMRDGQTYVVGFDKKGGVIQSCRVNITTMIFKNASSGTGTLFLGGLAGSAYSDGVSDSTVKIEETLEVSSVLRGACVGGLVGANKAPIENCTAELGKFSYTTTKNDDRAPYRIGGLVGLTHSPVTNCAAATAPMTVSVPNNNSGWWVGGLIGYIDGASDAPATDPITNVSSCSAEADMTLNCKCNKYNGSTNNYFPEPGAGGLVGGINTAVTVEKSYAVGRISGTTGLNADKVSNVGGLIGNAGGATISNCYAGVDVTNASATDVGGLIGSGTGSITNSCWLSGVFEYRGSTYTTSYADDGRAFTSLPTNPTISGMSAAQETIPSTNGNFPYLTGVTRDGKYVHYGQWPVYKGPVPAAAAVSLEEEPEEEAPEETETETPAETEPIENPGGEEPEPALPPEPPRQEAELEPEEEGEDTP